MRTRYLLAGLLSLALAACSSGATPAPSVEPSAQPPDAPASPSPQPPEAAAPAPAPTSTTSVLDVKVTFDGETCTYLGPSVILDGTVMRFEYAVDREFWGSFLQIYGVKPGTTWEMWIAAIEENPLISTENIPDWVYEETAAWVQGASTMLYKIEAVTTLDGGLTEYPVGGYQIVCNTTTRHPAAQLSVAGP